MSVDPRLLAVDAGGGDAAGQGEAEQAGLGDDVYTVGACISSLTRVSPASHELIAPFPPPHLFATLVPNLTSDERVRAQNASSTMPCAT